MIQEQGRSGSVIYHEPGGSINFPWEFGGNNVVATIYFDNEAAWRTHYSWAADRRSEILQRVASEVIRQRAPGCHAEIVQSSGWINIRQGTATQPVSAPFDHLKFRQLKSKFAMILAAIILAIAFGVIVLKSLFSVRAAAGTPIGLSVRTPQHIATLIGSLEPYVPSFHRNPANDRYRLALFLYPLDGASSGSMITLSPQKRIEEFNLTKLLGCDGRTVWFTLNGIGGVNLRTGKIIDETDLRRANPSLGESWEDQRRMGFDQRLRLTSEDRKKVYEVNADTLQAIQTQPSGNTPNLPFDPKPETFLSSGVRPSPSEWLGLHSSKEAAREYKRRSTLSRLNHAEDAEEPRSFHHAQLGPELDRGNREILSIERISEEEYLNAAFVRTSSDGDHLRLSGPDSFLIIYTTKAGLGGAMTVARVETTGKFLWKIDTGIDRFKLSQILPDIRFPAFIGTRPAVPNKVPEPILVVVDVQSGVALTSTLWK